MVKAELKKQRLLKACYGTKEWSENSGICCNCRLRNGCGKTEKKVKTRPQRALESPVATD